MKRKPKIIIKPSFFDIMRFKEEIYQKEALQYCITTFLAGLIFLFVSFPIKNEPTSSIIETISCSMFVISIYYIPLPFFNFEKTNEMFKKLSKYLLLLITTLSHSIVWHTYCNLTLNDFIFSIIIFFMSILQIALIILSVFYAIKPIMNAIKIITSKIIESVNSNEKNNTALLKNICAILPFITAILTFINTLIKM